MATRKIGNGRSVEAFPACEREFVVSCLGVRGAGEEGTDSELD